MISCHICLDDLKMPVSLPCGHIFCAECLRRAVEAIKPYSSLHSCPTCRSLYTVAPIDPAIVPPHLRPHLTPSIRKVYLDHPALDAISTTTANSQDSESSSSSASPTPPSPLAIEAARLRAENSALRTNCNMWRRRAEVHGAATLGLLELTRMARDQAVQIARERDEFQRRCNTLKRKLHDEESILQAIAVPSVFIGPAYPASADGVYATTSAMNNSNASSASSSAHRPSCHPHPQAPDASSSTSHASLILPAVLPPSMHSRHDSVSTSATGAPTSVGADTGNEDGETRSGEPPKKRARLQRDTREHEPSPSALASASASATAELNIHVNISHTSPSGCQIPVHCTLPSAGHIIPKRVPEQQPVT